MRSVELFRNHVPIGSFVPCEYILYKKNVHSLADIEFVVRQNGGVSRDVNKYSALRGMQTI